MPRGRPPSTSKPTSTPPKRALSPETKSLTPPSRQSKRLKSSPLASSTVKATPKKSQFFKHDSTTSDPEPESEIEDEASGYEDEDASASVISSPPESESEEEAEEVSSEEEKTKAKRRRSNGKRGSAVKTLTNGAAATAKAIVEKGKELWRPGVKTNLPPGQQVFIKLPKARGDGGIKYEEGIIHPNTLLFLQDLKENNDREWLKGRNYVVETKEAGMMADVETQSVHDAEYRQSKKDWDAFVEKMTEKMTEIDDTIPELPAKDLV
ncbi:MAG: hypothetical protein Q9207_007582 [Kuettlingeria erythrocarpa]